MKVINTPNAPAAVGPYSQGIESDAGILFFSGQIPLTADGDMIDGDIVEQTTQIFANIEALLEAAEIAKENVVKVTVFLADMEDFKTMNGIYAAFFGDHKPARSTIQVARLPLDAKVEIEITAQQ